MEDYVIDRMRRMHCTHRTRMAKSSAKLNFRSEVTACDAVFAIHLYEEALLLRTGNIHIRPTSPARMSTCYCKLIYFATSCVNLILRFLARNNVYAGCALYAISRPSVRLSFSLSVTRVVRSKTVEVRIMQFSPHSSE